MGAVWDISPSSSRHIVLASLSLVFDDQETWVPQEWLSTQAPSQQSAAFQNGVCWCGGGNPASSQIAGVLFRGGGKAQPSSWALVTASLWL